MTSICEEKWKGNERNFLRRLLRRQPGFAVWRKKMKIGNQMTKMQIIAGLKCLGLEDIARRELGWQRLGL